MRHGNKVNHLGRKNGHRAALLKNLSCSLIMHKRINTTIAKAKVLRTHLEPLITKAKDNTTHSRRVVFSYLQDNDATKELFGVVAEKVADRPGGYLRIIKTGFRLGDGAPTAMIEFVDFNDVYSAQGSKADSKKKRTRRSGASKKETTAKAPEAISPVIEETKPEVADNIIEEKVVETAAPVVEETKEDVSEAVNEEIAEEPTSNEDTNAANESKEEEQV